MTHPLRELVGKATPGPWAESGFNDERIWIYGGEHRARIAISEIGLNYGQNIAAETAANAALIVAMRNSIDSLLDEVEGLRAERDEAQRVSADWARQAGEAKGQLRASKWPGIRDGWRARALAAEARAERLRAALEIAADELSVISSENDADNPEGYRADDREGCLEWTFSHAARVEAAARLALSDTDGAGS